MGSLPRLKLKNEMNYRKGSTNESVNCRYCVNRVDVKVGEVFESRCRIMGLKDSIRYRVRPDYRCDAQQWNGK